MQNDRPLEAFKEYGVDSVYNRNNICQYRMGSVNNRRRDMKKQKPSEAWTKYYIKYVADPGIDNQMRYEALEKWMDKHCDLRRGKK